MQKTIKMVKKQMKGINRQVRHVSRDLGHMGKDFGHQIDRRRHNSHPGLTTGLLLIGATCVAGFFLLGKAGMRNRETIKQLFLTEKGENSQGQKKDQKQTQGQIQPVIEKIQTQFISFLEQVGFHPQQRNGGDVQEKETVKSGQRQIQTMGDV